MPVLNFQAPSDLIDAIRHRAKASDRSMAAEIRIALRNHVREMPHPPSPRPNEATQSTPTRVASR